MSNVELITHMMNSMNVTFIFNLQPRHTTCALHHRCVKSINNIITPNLSIINFPNTYVYNCTNS